MKSNAWFGAIFMTLACANFSAEASGGVKRSIGKYTGVSTSGNGTADNDTCSCDGLAARMAILEQRMRNIAPPAGQQRNQSYPQDCAHYLRLGFNTSGIYTVTLEVPDAFLSPFQKPTSINLEVYCDMDSDGGGWTVFQRHQSDLVSFDRNWFGYKRGFGFTDRDFWWGNENLALALNDGRVYDLRVDLFDWAGAHRYAKYAHFHVAGEDDNYRLNVGHYAGNAGDSLGYHDNMQFSTPDRDNDLRSTNCAASYNNGFWFNTCQLANINYAYSRSSAVTSDWYGVIWNTWHGYQYSLMKTEMKFRATGWLHPVAPGFECQCFPA